MNDDPPLSAPESTTGTCALAGVLKLTPLVELYNAPGQEVVDDPLRIMARQDTAAAEGDLGVAVRAQASTFKATIERKAAETLESITGRATFFDNGGYGTVAARWVTTAQKARDDALATLDDVYAQGLAISKQFKADASEDELTTAAEVQYERINDVPAAYGLAVASVSSEVQEATTTIKAYTREQKAQFDAAHGAAETAVTELLRWDYAEAADFNARLKDNWNTAIAVFSGGGFAAGAKTAKVILTEANAVKESGYDEYKTRFNAFIDKINSIETKIKKKDGVIWGTKLNSEHLENTRVKVKAAHAMASSGRNLEALKLADAMATDAEALIDAINSSSSNLVTNAQNALLKLINAKKKKRPEDAKAMEKRLTDLVSSVRGEAPQTAEAKINRFGTDFIQFSGDNWATFENRVARQEGWKTTYKAEYGALKSEISAFNRIFGDRDYSGSLVNDLAALKSLIDGELGPTVGDNAASLVAQMRTKIDQFKPAIGSDDDIPALTKARDAILADQAEAMQAQEDERLAKEAFENLLLDAEGKLNRIRALVSTEISADPGLAAGFATCEEMLKSAKKSAKDTKDYATATLLVAAAERDMEKHEKRATGEIFNGLKDIGKYWDRGARAIAADVVRLKASMRSACTDNESEDRSAQLTSVEGALDTMVARFAIGAFDASAAKYAGGLSKADRKREREVVLKQVRFLRDALTGSPVMKAAVGNPFGENGIGSELFAQLNLIELETLRTV